MFLIFHEIESFFKQQIMILYITQEMFVQVKFFFNYYRPDYLTSELFVEPCEKSWYNCSATGTSSFPSTVSQMKRAPTQRRLSTFNIIIISFFALYHFHYYLSKSGTLHNSFWPSFIIIISLSFLEKTQHRRGQADPASLYAAVHLEL